MARRKIMPDHEALALKYLGACMGADVEELEQYDASERDCSYRTFRNNFTKEEFAALREGFKYEADHRSGLAMQYDWHVRFGWGYYQGIRVFCFHHSRIHYFFVAPETRKKKNA